MRKLNFMYGNKISNYGKLAMLDMCFFFEGNDNFKETLINEGIETALSTVRMVDRKGEYTITNPSWEYIDSCYKSLIQYIDVRHFGSIAITKKYLKSDEFYKEAFKL